MSAMELLRKPREIGAFLLGNFAALWGFFVAPIYVISFALMLPYLREGVKVGGGYVTLPIGLPLIGLSLAVAGWMICCPDDERALMPIRIGLTLNGLGMGLAIVLWMMAA